MNPTTLRDHKLTGAPPWYLQQYEPKEDADFPLTGFLTKELPNPFPGPRKAKTAVSTRTTIVMRLVLVLLFAWWGLGRLAAAPDAPEMAATAPRGLKGIRFEDNGYRTTLIPFEILPPELLAENNDAPTAADPTPATPVPAINSTGGLFNAGSLFQPDG